ncbi:amidohydrolase family protein [Lysobacter sp. A6]|uniref:Amidohydrolase family protein n=1 Tax=Noviluteimonas lactosilytica TaxID=2888523 RepID=A0ABS8JI34_9GAMM|nr:amidohydrolase family protein [Lysobacter lactosilyticus]MCC8363263.1 amidohydrolase family protein [Lysobacter lactosilyticus]
MGMRAAWTVIAWILLASTTAALAAAQDTSTPQAETAQPTGNAVLFRNVRVFDGVSSQLSAPTNVLVRGNVIASISADAAAATDARVIDGGGRILMPGLIDVHWHNLLVGLPVIAALQADEATLNIVGVVEAQRTLMRGFTTVRDVGGPSFSLKRAIDQGRVPGPRIWPAGAMISVTSGHGDFRTPRDLPRTLGAPASFMDEIGGTAIADSPDEVRIRVREQLKQGAALIKLTAGGGVSSPSSPLDVVTFSEEELRAAVGAANDWGTYVTVHAYTPEAIQRAIRAGVQCIEHASLMDDESARMIARTGTWLSAQPLPRELADAFPVGSTEWLKAQEVFDGTDQTYKLAKKYKLKTAWGTDVLFSSALAGRQGAILASMSQWFSPPEILIMATSTNAELLKLSGKRTPYKNDVGVIKEGAFADLLLVEGNPLEDINLVADPERNFKVIMKDGVIYKDTL